MRHEKEVVDNNDRLRQVTISGLNVSVALLSTYDHEDMDYLACKALELLRLSVDK